MLMIADCWKQTLSGYREAADRDEGRERIGCRYNEDRHLDPFQYRDHLLLLPTLFGASEAFPGGHFVTATRRDHARL